VELQARLEQRNIDSYGLSVFFSTDFGQRFYVRPQVSTTFAGIRRESLVRLRGICTTDAIDTNNRVPFTVLLREPDDVIVLSGPPWWSTGNLIAIAIGLLCLALLLYLLRLRAERWKLRAISGERQRLAHELHDTLAQSFAGIGFHLSAVRKQLPAQLSALKAQIDVANDLVRQGHLEARQSIATLRPNVFDSIAILPSLEQAAQKIVRGSGIELDLSESGAVRDIPLKVKDTLYRVALEAIANAARHAGPSRISVALLYHKRSLQLVIEDDGKGFQLDQVTSDSFGLKGIAERMRSIDGSFGVSSIPSHGTTVCVDAPIPSQHHLTRLLAFVSRKQQIP
jgi:signal transduction histidine kinase